MPHHQQSLRDLIHEARDLEFDLDLSTGRIELRKRSNPATCYRSDGPPNDRQCIADAWGWLQWQRARMERADAARQIPPQHKRRNHTTALFRMFLHLWLLPFVVACPVQLLTDSLWIGGGTFCVVSLLQWLRLRWESQRQRSHSL